MMDLKSSLDSPAVGQVKALTQSKQFWTNALAGLLMLSSMFGWHVSLDPGVAADQLPVLCAALRVARRRRRDLDAGQHHLPRHVRWVEDRRFLQTADASDRKRLDLT